MKLYKNILLVSLLISGIISFFYIQFQEKPKHVYIKSHSDSSHTVFVTDESELEEEEKKTIALYENTSHAVVYITSYKTEYINYFFDVVPQTSEGQGSGVILDSKGYIVTNFHVVGNADKLLVTLSGDGDTHEAEIIGTDPENDLAVIKLISPPKDLQPITIGTSTSLKIGQKVFAIGNPFGYDRTLTSGIISALGRSIKTESGNVIDGAIQTDASINPGNSGGPLLDSSGKIIGINTIIVSPSRGSVGIGFAIPIDKVKEVVPELIQYGYVKRGWIDATFLPVTSRISRALELGIDQGLMVMQVAQNGEAYKSGLRGGSRRAVYGDQIIYIGGEVLTQINNIQITDYSSLVNALKDSKIGDIINVTYINNRTVHKTKIKLIDKGKFLNKY